MQDKPLGQFPHPPAPSPDFGRGGDARLPSPAGGRGVGGEGEKILLLAGTAEGAALARQLAADPGIELIVSLAGRVNDLPDLPGRLRVGGFGGVEGLTAFLLAEKITRVIDATHPFAKAISAHAEVACLAAKIPLERRERPLWRRRPGDRWHWADDLPMAARMAARMGRRILLTTGKGSIAPFARFGGPAYVVRLIEPPAKPLGFSQAAIVLGRGPFSLEDEMALMRRFAVDLLVTKASGGRATEAKLTAARLLKIPVILVKRP